MKSIHSFSRSASQHHSNGSMNGLSGKWTPTPGNVNDVLHPCTQLHRQERVHITDPVADLKPISGRFTFKISPFIYIGK